MKYISTKKISSYLNNKRYTSCSTTGSLKGMKKLLLLYLVTSFNHNNLQGTDVLRTFVI